MRVFIGWSGPLSREVSDILRRYLPCMIQGLDVFLSRHDLQSGERWGLEIANVLADSSFGILCLTMTNEKSAWILYEAGALTKQLDGKACGLLLGELTPANISGPLAQFQHRRMNEADFFRLVKDLNTGLDQPLDADQVKLVFEKWWPDIRGEYERALDKGDESSAMVDQRPDRDLLEELLVRARNVDRLPRSAGRDMVPKTWVKTFVKNIVDQIPDSERDLLNELVVLKRSGAHDDASNLGKEFPEDLVGLADKGLVQVNKNNGKISLSRTLWASDVFDTSE